ncbi:WD40 repeat-like protein [Saccharata proteae CBS 121410]|uniref:WD40 repeat-like protein n=1 Tax=Saccharata proteae CBS 121410 TaxID=1314787 RepID=A0A9P4M1G0_9PEZI|nr:WD40 repeat-like protein [Saccharata proteae CBS 121410]
MEPACPAKGAFPFPPQARHGTSLSPLALRRRVSPIKSDPNLQPASGGSPFRNKIASKNVDRFILPRKSPRSSNESLRLSMPVYQLSDAERYTRNRYSAPDPFSRKAQRRGRPTESFPRRQVPARGRSQTNRGTVPGQPPTSGPLALRHGTRQVSNGAVWNVGGSAIVADSVSGVPDGRGGMISSGTNAPLYTSMFLAQSDPASEMDAHQGRLAVALDIDRTSRVLGHFDSPNSSGFSPSTASTGSVSPIHDNSRAPTWINTAWTREGVTILDAPSLRDDFYCSLLAYCHTAKCLAVGLNSNVYLWSESQGVATPESLNNPHTSHVTSLSFSSVAGAQAILAVGRADGHVTLWSLFDSEPRFKSHQPQAISCVSFRPTPVKRTSKRDSAATVNTEDLLIGDESGHIYFYSIEWPNEIIRNLFDWPGAMTLLFRISVHTQQVCGLAWSPQGDFFATGGNDNACFLYETKKVMTAASARSSAAPPISVRQTSAGTHRYTVIPGRGTTPDLDASCTKHKIPLIAAVKAIAFCPWQRGLIAIGGGSNDRCIHFYHTMSGACLATIDCAAQVTSLIWSTTRREIAATFGFAQPEHNYRIAVFAWPSCEQLVAIPWPDEHRALYAIPYPGGPNNGTTKGEGGAWWSRTQVEGCVVVATSDASIKFHEIWTEDSRRRRSGGGPLGSSDILEGLHGIEKEGSSVIR